MMWPFKRDPRKIVLRKENRSEEFQTTLGVQFCSANTLQDLENLVNVTCYKHHVRAIGIRVNMFKQFKYTAFISYILRIDDQPIPFNSSYTLQLKILTEHDLSKLVENCNMTCQSILADSVDFAKISETSSVNDMMESAGVSKASYAAFITYRVSVRKSVK